ncbi:FkbM family methyltransferase [Butyrivibrio sp. XPD2002]|uniref:FkbM family methyltransferase n=1 Tax=Butyrivibrio sp. XPD2002 TaxID=1280665 RepID=UPI00047C395D|nr:FkbM family methyltransferase [Butyrivibrio sp. XPD2002]
MVYEGQDNISIKICSIDDTPECEGASFIKMDIEGAEWDALHGAEKTICRNKPKLALCIYHSDEDMIRIAEYIHELVPEYRLYVRHHTRRNHETVLYAVI